MPVLPESYKSYKPHPNNATVNHLHNLPGLYPEKFKVYIAPGNNQTTWKAINDMSANISVAAVAQNSRPQTNLSVINTPYNRAPRSNGKGPLNPIKHWRKQLMAVAGSGSSKATVGQAMDYPGGSVHLDKVTDCSCAPVLTNYLIQYPVDCSNCPVIHNALSNYQPVTINNPQRITRPRSSNTILKKNYYTTGAAYLRSRVKLYEQNQLLSAIPGNTYANSEYLNVHDQPPPGPGPGHFPSMYVPPSNSLTGSQAFNSTYCISDPSACCSTNLDGSSCATRVTYKPSNITFSVQGAVSSGTRILDIKRRAIVTNNTNFSQLNVNQEKINLSVNGKELPGSTPIHYRGNTAAPYFIKSKYQQIDECAPGTKNSTHSKNRIDGRMPSGGTGIKTVCFPRPKSPNIYSQD
jgi:hypothetical protein